MLINLPNASNPEPDEDVIEELQRLLADARTGNVQGFAAVYYCSTDDGFLTLSSVICGTAANAEITTVGALNTLATSISASAIRDAD